MLIIGQAELDTGILKETQDMEKSNFSESTSLLINLRISNSIEGQAICHIH